MGLETVVRGVGADAGLLWAWDGQVLSILGTRGTAREMFGSGELMSGEGMSGRSLLELKPLATSDINGDCRVGFPGSGFRKLFKSLVAVPLVLERRPFGAVTVLDKRSRVFTPYEQATIQLLGQRLALCLHQCMFFPHLTLDWLAVLQGKTQCEVSVGQFVQACGSLPKGVNQVTLDFVVSALESAQGDVTSAELSRMTGLSQTTLRHYLSYMHGSGMVARSPAYGGPGRPLYRYRLDRNPTR